MKHSILLLFHLFLTIIPMNLLADSHAVGIGTRIDFEYTEQMLEFDFAVHPQFSWLERDPVPLYQNPPTRYLLQQVQQFRQTNGIAPLEEDTVFIKAAQFHNQEMIDYQYMSTDFAKDGFDYRNLFIYMGFANDYNQYSYVFQASSLAELEQQFFGNDSLTCLLQRPEINCVGLYVTPSEDHYFCTVYLSERYIHFLRINHQSGISPGLKFPAALTKYFGKTSLKKFTLKVFFHGNITPKTTLTNIDVGKPVQEQKIIPDANGEYKLTLRYWPGPSRFLIFYDEQDRPVAIRKQNKLIQQERTDP